MDAKIAPKDVMDLSLFKFGGRNSLQPTNQNFVRGIYWWEWTVVVDRNSKQRWGFCANRVRGNFHSDSAWGGTTMTHHVRRNVKTSLQHTCRWEVNMKIGSALTRRLQGQIQLTDDVLRGQMGRWIENVTTDAGMWDAMLVPPKSKKTLQLCRLFRFGWRYLLLSAQRCRNCWWNRSTNTRPQRHICTGSTWLWTFLSSQLDRADRQVWNGPWSWNRHKRRKKQRQKQQKPQQKPQQKLQQNSSNHSSNHSINSSNKTAATTAATTAKTAAEAAEKAAAKAAKAAAKAANTTANAPSKATSTAAKAATTAAMWKKQQQMQQSSSKSSKHNKATETAQTRILGGLWPWTAATINDETPRGRDERTKFAAEQIRNATGFFQRLNSWASDKTEDRAKNRRSSHVAERWATSPFAPDPSQLSRRMQSADRGFTPLKELVAR